jgi:uncharacterized membrane protein (GlpM family)
MKGPEEHRPRKLRLAAAYGMFTLGCVPGVLAFFFVKDILPEVLMRPSRLTWVVFAIRLLIQVAVSAIALLVVLLPTFALIRRLLNEAEYRHFQLKIDEMQI